MQLLISDLIVCSVSGLVLLQLLLPLSELSFRVADVATEAVWVEVVVAARLGELLSLLKTHSETRSMNVFAYFLADADFKNISGNGCRSETV